MKMMLYIIIGIGVVVAWLVVRHQRRLRTRARLMSEAIRNRDFQFRLKTDGLMPGERAMQETLNQLGDIIRQQTRQSEVESWERLTRVLTHEIMNATAPIASISQAMMARKDVQGTELEEGIRAMHTAARHLGDFVDSYRKFSSLQQPVPEEVRVAEVVEEVRGLFPELEWCTEVNGEMTVRTDRGLLRQVLINLTKNAAEAGAKRMSIRGTEVPREKGEPEGRRRVSLLVWNDGRPIPAEARGNIFVPFFTTKRCGSGIGLSLSRRIVTMQGGSLELLEGPLTTFALTL